jgi:hypothetical protein
VLTRGVHGVPPLRRQGTPFSVPQAAKKLDFGTPPENLVVHLKRWEFVKGRGARKLETPVQFPATGLDISPHVLGCKQVCPLSLMHNSGIRASPASGSSSARRG